MTDHLNTCVPILYYDPPRDGVLYYPKVDDLMHTTIQEFQLYS